MSSRLNYAIAQRIKEAVLEEYYPKFEVLLKEIPKQGLNVFVYARGVKESYITYRMTNQMFMSFFHHHQDAGHFPECNSHEQVIEILHNTNIVLDFVKDRMDVDKSLDRPEEEAIADIKNFRKKILIRDLKKRFK